MHRMRGAVLPGTAWQFSRCLYATTVPDRFSFYLRNNYPGLTYLMSLIPHIDVHNPREL